MIDNNQKYETYRLLKLRLKKALVNSFWFEALMIEYAIVEDRTSSILQYAGVCSNAFDPNKMLSNKLNSIRLQIEKGHPILSVKTTTALIDEIKMWKDSRNEIVHRACNHVYDEEKTKNIALVGENLVKRLDNDSRKIRNACKKENTYLDC